MTTDTLTRLPLRSETPALRVPPGRIEKQRLPGPRQRPAHQLGQERDDDHSDEGAGAGGLGPDEERQGNEEEERQEPHLRTRQPAVLEGTA